MRIKLKKLIFPLLVGMILGFASSCKKNDEDSTQHDTIIVKQYEVVTLYFASGKLTNIEYNALFGNNSIQLVKLNDTTLIMSVPLVEPNIYTLEITGLGTYKNSFKVLKTELTDTPEEIVNDLTTAMYDYISALPDTDTDKVGILKYISDFNNLFEEATTAEKERIALFYEANKTSFDEILYGNYTSLKSTSNCVYCVSSSIKFKMSVLAMGAGVAVTWLAPDGLTRLTGALVAIIGYKKAVQYGLELTTKRLNVVEMVIASIMGTQSTTLKSTTTLKFYDGVQQELSMQVQNRCINENDRQATPTEIQVFFYAFDNFNSSIDKLNSVISFVNENVPFTNISLIQNFQLQNLSNETYDLPGEVFDNFTFSIVNPNISLSTSFSSKGKVLLKININDNYLYTEPIVTKMNVTYTDGFNNISKDFDIIVSQTEPFSIEKVSGDNQTGQLGQALANPIKVLVKDEFGNPYSGAKVNFTANNGGSISQTQVTTDADGIASVTWTLGATDNNQTLEVSCFKNDGITSVSGSPLTFKASTGVYIYNVSIGITDVTLTSLNPPIFISDDFYIEVRQSHNNFLEISIKDGAGNSYTSEYTNTHLSGISSGCLAVQFILSDGSEFATLTNRSFSFYTRAERTLTIKQIKVWVKC
jgi:hypothetical protein